MESLGRAYLRLKVRDPAVREQLTPRYAIGCKRPGFHNSYLSTYNRDNVRLVTEPIDKITPSAVATTDGTDHEVDVLVLATGFHVFDSDSMPTFAVTGSGGQSLTEFWEENRAAGLRGHHHSRLSQSVQRDGAVRLRRVVVLRPDRGADTPHAALHEARPAARRHPGRDQPRRPTPAISPSS